MAFTVAPVAPATSTKPAFQPFTGLKRADAVTRKFAKSTGSRRLFQATEKPAARVQFSVSANAEADKLTEATARVVTDTEIKKEADEKCLHIGVIGAGRIGTVHADTIAFRIKNARLTSVASGSVSSAQRCALLTGCELVYDYHDMIKDPKVDAIVIAGPSDTHTQMVIECAEAGKHIFCEKPVDIAIENVDKCVDAVKKSGVKFMVGLNRRFDPNYMRIRKALAEKEIGDLHLLHIFSRDPAPPPLYYVKQSGGMFLDMTMHDFDMANFLISAQDPTAKAEEIYTMAGCMVDPEIGKLGDVDTAITQIRYTNGVIVSIDNSRQAVYGYDQRCEAFGSKGSIQSVNNYPSNTEVKQGDLPLNFFMDRYTESFINIMEDFVDNVLNDREMSVPIKCGRDPVVMAIAARKSHDEKRPVKLTEIDPNW
eukprot:tig00020675_g12678.t1